MRSIALVALVGCTLAPRYERPALPVPDRFPSGGGTLAAADTGWHAMFRDPRLQALIGLALANNRDLRVAALNVELARAQFQVQRAQLLPQVAGNAAWARIGGRAMTPPAGTPSLIPKQIWVVGALLQFEI